MIGGKGPSSIAPGIVEHNHGTYLESRRSRFWTSWKGEHTCVYRRCILPQRHSLVMFLPHTHPKKHRLATQGHLQSQMCISQAANLIFLQPYHYGQLWKDSETTTWLCGHTNYHLTYNSSSLYFVNRRAFLVSFTKLLLMSLQSWRWIFLRNVGWEIANLRIPSVLWKYQHLVLYKNWYR